MLQAYFCNEKNMIMDAKCFVNCKALLCNCKGSLFNSQCIEEHLKNFAILKSIIIISFYKYLLGKVRGRQLGKKVYGGSSNER